MISFSWLHLTDLHLGMSGQPSLLPAIKDRFFEDLKPLHEKSGPWDLVLFTGDLAMRGSAEEFKSVDAFLNELWERLRQLGSVPTLFAVPGNHDLARPDPNAAEVLILGDLFKYPKAQSDFWNVRTSRYRTTVSDALANYTTWWDKQKLRPNPNKVQAGVLPGDFSAVIEKSGASLGIVGLNTTALQLTDSNYKGKLASDPIQFQAVCGGDGPAWVKKHNACLLLTHQPPDWLTPESQAKFESDIMGDDYFAVHLFGHMHEAQYKVVSQGGGPASRVSQGTSLFGLEYYMVGEQKKEDRRHGYAAGRIDLDGSKGSLTIWPRAASLPGGKWNFAPDTREFRLQDEHTDPAEFDLHRALEPAPSPAPIEGPAPARGPFPNEWAVLVGINDYDRVAKLQYCRQDVIDLASAFRDTLGFQSDCVFEFHENSELKPERDVVFRKLADLRDSRKVGADDLLVFYFSGHGVNAAGRDYLLPIHASERDVRTLGIGVQDLMGALQETGSKNIAMFIDACRETVQGAKGTAAIGEDSKAAASQAGIITFFSCDPKDRSYEIDKLQHGSFTYCLIQAIRQGAATTVSQLDDYLRENVPQINTTHQKPPQQPYVVVGNPQQASLPIFFNPRQVRQAEQKFETLIDQLTALSTAGTIEAEDFEKAVDFLGQSSDKKPLDPKERTKLSAIQALCAGRWTLMVFRRVWNATQAPGLAAPQIKKLPPLTR